jgi:hypothetical protein
VNYTVILAENIYGVGIRPLSSSFFIDLTPPFFENLTPQPSLMVLNVSPVISFRTQDLASGLNHDSPRIEIPGFGSYDVNSPYVSYSSGSFTLNTANAGIVFPSGDTITIRAYSSDNPDYCDDNVGFIEWSFNVEPTILCHNWPNPFTPNDDGHNDETIFNFPFMFSKGSILKIFSSRNTLVYESDLSNVSSFNEFARRSWDGRDSNGQKLSPGLYLYIITRDGELICAGSVTLIRYSRELFFQAPAEFFWTGFSYNQI